MTFERFLIVIVIRYFSKSSLLRVVTFSAETRIYDFLGCYIH